LRGQPLREQPPRERQRPQDPSNGAANGAAASSSQLIRQRDTALPDDRRVGLSTPVAAIAPDGLDSFARDLRALRSKAELDYPEMAERSHYTMKTLASAAGGLRLPTLPVAMAYVRACDGDETEWEDRWHKLAERITADAAKNPKKQSGDDEAPVEPADASVIVTAPPEPTPPPAADSGEVFVITSAKPREQGWFSGDPGR
jgi:hypothetical protein